MRGKYSPTVSRAYMQDQDWHRKFCNLAPHSDVIYSPYDPEGYDSYGYDKNEMDRAGNYEHAYYPNDNPDWDSEDDYNWKYDSAHDDWVFDGVKPVRK